MELLLEVKWIIEKAAEHNVTLSHVAKLAGLHHSQIHRWRDGKASPTVNSFNKVRAVFAALDVKQRQKASKK